MYPGYQEVEVALIFKCVYAKAYVLVSIILEPIHLVFCINQKEISEY